LRKKSIENEPITRQPTIAPLLIKLGACLLVLNQTGLFKDLNSLLDNPVPAEAKASARTLATTLLPNVAVVSTPEIASDGTELLGDGWYLEGNYHEVIQQLSIEPWQKDFLVMAVDSISETIRHGLLVNPRIGVMQTALETGYGKHLAAKNNYYGQIAYGDEPYQLTNTFEEENGVIVHKSRKFKVFETAYASFLQYATKIDELPHFADAKACRGDDAAYAMGLQNYADPATCTLILPQGAKNSKGEIVVDSYATATNYTDVLLSMVESKKMGKIFTRRDQQ
jgi:hypothetical protein